MKKYLRESLLMAIPAERANYIITEPEKRFQHFSQMNIANKNPVEEVVFKILLLIVIVTTIKQVLLYWALFCFLIKSKTEGEGFLKSGLFPIICDTFLKPPPTSPVGSVFWLLIQQFKFLGTIEFLVSIWIQNIQILPPFCTL